MRYSLPALLIPLLSTSVFAGTGGSEIGVIETITPSHPTIVETCLHLFTKLVALLY